MPLSSIYQIILINLLNKQNILFVIWFKGYSVFDKG